MNRLMLMVAVLFVAAVPSYAEVTDINNEQLAKLLAEGVMIVDVRTPAEWKDTGIIAGSRKLTFFDSYGRYDIPKWTGDLKEIAKPSDPLILICRTGSRTISITELIDKKHGYIKVYNVKRGIYAWINEKRPVEKSH